MVTNFFKITFPFTEFGIQQLLYDEDKLRGLREHHNHEASFFRHGDFIYISPAKSSSLVLGKAVNLSISENAEIVASLIRHLVFRTFRDAFPDRVPDGFSPLRFPSTRPEHDMIRELLPSDLQGKISFTRVNEVFVRVVVQGGKPLFGLVITSRHRWSFTPNLFVLSQEKFPLEGSTVVESIPIPGLEGVLAADETVLGMLMEVKNGEAQIETNLGTVNRSLSELHIQRSREQIGRYLEFRLDHAKATEIFRRVQNISSERANPNYSFGEIRKVAEWFASRKYENAEGFSFAVTSDSSFTGQAFQLDETRLVFDYAPGASNKKPFGGLSRFGPLDSSRFDCKSPKLLVIFNERDRGAITQFLAQLIDGIPASRYFQKGLRDMYHLHKVDFTLKSIQSDSPEEYEKAIDESIQQSDARSFDLALVACIDESRQLFEANNPYIRAKARLMSYGIPVQGVRESHLRSHSSTLQYTLGPMALQMYAKLGGIPWLLPGSQSIDHELIIGIGSTIHRPNLWSDAEQSRIVGMTTFFLGDGRYILGQELQSVPYSEYFQTLLKSLSESINEVSSEYAWKDGDVVRIVFHVFKPLKNVEVEVVDQLVKKFDRYKVLCAFVTISTNHPWMLFQDALVRKGKTEVVICQRGQNLIMDDKSCLLQLRGPDDRPNKGHRPPYPVLVRLHDMSTYKDLQYIAQQILDFSYLSWRSFFPNETPVTIFYSELMASLSAKLQRVEGWNPVFLNQHFRRKKWFL